MTPQIIAKLMPIALEELRNEKICLIEDIFKLRRFNPSLGISGNKSVIETPELIFDDLYDMNIEDLQLEYAHYSAIMSRKTRLMAGIDKAGYQSDADDDLRNLMDDGN